VYGPRPIIQTFDADARDLEMHAKRVWAIYCEQPAAHRRALALERRVTELSAQLSRLNVPWDEWQLLYRLLLQVDRALHGDEPLLEHAQRVEVREMADEKVALLPPRNEEKLPQRRGLQTQVPASLQAMSNRELIGHTISSATELAKKEIELAKSELRQDIQREVAMAKGLGVAGLCAIWTVSMMLVAAAFALATVMAGWAAALIVAAAVLLVGTIAGLLGWGKRVKQPLEATRRTVKEGATWAKERLA
jgi:hypothetical protein